MFGFRMTAVHAEARYADLLRDAEVERQAKKDQVAHARRMLELLYHLRACDLLKVH